MQRKIYHIAKVGDLKDLKIIDQELADPSPHEVQVKVKAFGLNFADVFAVYGLYSASPNKDFIPGLEFSGEVVKIGTEVKDFNIGDKVMGVSRFGAYANFLNTNTYYITPLPERWTFEHGASYLVQVLTAYYALFPLGAMQGGETVLIHSAAGGVGLWANRIAKKYNAYTVGTIGSPSKRELLEKEGYDKVIVRSKSFRADLKSAIDGRDLNIVLECIGGDIFMDSYVTMARMGRLIVYGSARYASPTDKPNWIKMAWQFYNRPKIDPQKMIEQNKSIVGFNMIYLFENHELMHDYLGELSKLDLGLRHVGHVFEFDQVLEALRLFVSGKTTGKLVVRTDN
jgi:alcohol dehydrogenase